jgi:uncharacterized protein
VVRTDAFDLSGLRLATGEGRRLELEVALDPLLLGGQEYVPEPPQVPVTLDISRMSGGGYALHMAFEAAVAGPCMRCLADAHPSVSIEAREVELPGGGEELDSPYVEHDTLDVRSWAHDALALALPDQIVCSDDCLGLCPVCARPLRELEAGHRHETAPDRRWSKLAEFEFDR